MQGKEIKDYTKQNPVTGDAALGVDSSDATKLFNLGTAAAADVTTSATDATAGRVMRIDDYPGDAEWTSTTTLENDWTGTVRYIKRAGTVTVMWDIDGAAKTTDTFLTLVAAYRPAVELKQGATDGHIVIGTAGTLVSESTGATIGMATYPVMV